MFLKFGQSFLKILHMFERGLDVSLEFLGSVPPSFPNGHEFSMNDPGDP